MWSNEEDVEDGQCYACGRKELPTVLCSVCDEWEYCVNCRVVCQCGQGPEHYLCRSDGHLCRSECCPAMLCHNAMVPVYSGCVMDHDDPSQWDGDSWCKDHRPPVSDQMKELVLGALSYDELEKALSAKRAKIGEVK
jgi:hypothetical protein